MGKYKLKILDEALTDRFIVGLNNYKIKQHLLNEEKLTFEDCCAKALQMEMVQKESKSLQNSSIKVLNYGQNFYSKSKRSQNKSQDNKKS